MNRSSIVVAATLSAFAACEGAARLPVSAGMGVAPELPPPDRGLFPAVEIAEAKGWPSGGKPLAAPGLVVTTFATGLNHPRWLYVLPNGDVLVAETNAPPNRDNRPGIKGWFFKYFQKKAGGAVPSADRITLLRDADADGTAESRSMYCPASSMIRARRWVVPSAWPSTGQVPCSWRTTLGTSCGG